MHDTGLADRLRAAGLRVVEMAGWRERGSNTFNPRVSVNHHTAAGGIQTAPSLATIMYGKPGTAGPLANALQSREVDGQDDIFYVVAAGRANHAGVGGWKGYIGNSSAWGLEIEHNGVSPLSDRRQWLAARFHAAAISLRHRDAQLVCQHKEWAQPPGRKIDAATHVDPNAFRGYVTALLGSSPPPPSPPSSGGKVVKQVKYPFADATGKQGYYFFKEDGSVHAYGNAVYKGGSNDFQHAPIVDMAVRPQGDGYAQLTLTGDVYIYPTGANSLPHYGGVNNGSRFAVSIAYAPDGLGYWIFAKNADGSDHLGAFGSAQFLGRP